MQSLKTHSSLLVLASLSGALHVGSAGSANAGLRAEEEPVAASLAWSEKDQRALKKMVSEVKEKGDWYKLDIDGFSLRSQVSADFTGELGLYMERLLAIYEGLFPGRPTLGAICEVVVHPDPEDFKNAVRAMQVMSGGKSERAEFVWNWDVQNKAIKSYGLHLHATSKDTLADLPRDELNGALLRCFNQRLVGWNPMAPWFEFGVTTWMGPFQPELDLAENKEAHPPTWTPTEEVDAKAKLPRTPTVLGPLLEAERDEIAGSAEKQDQCGSFLEFLTEDKAGTKTLKTAVDYMTKSRPVEIAKKTAIQLERGWLVHVSERATESRGNEGD